MLLERINCYKIKNEKKAGLYKHYKGEKYRVIGVAKHSETLEDLVVYEALYENDMSNLWVRPVDMFFDKVEFNGKEIRRFSLLKEQNNI